MAAAAGMVATALVAVLFRDGRALDERLAAIAERLIAADGTRMAGPGETVYWEASREAALTLDPSFVPVDHAIVGIVDEVAELPGAEDPA